MARFCMVNVLFALAATPLTAQTVVRADGDSAAMAEIAALEYHLIDLLDQRDLKSYASYLAEDYMRVNASGEVSDKDEALAGFASASMAGRMSPSDIEVRIYGDTAILSFVLTLGREGEPQRRNRLVKVFVRRDGRWIMVHNQGSPID
ncbi:MAG TPA: nuclear transport factor 2 family protein [Gemmatimonadota bacterium]|nr:nuclear transport factor 2 family protein [Gemmatimonadota bacterium]